jgi:hypothetical protein
VGESQRAAEGCSNYKESKARQTNDVSLGSAQDRGGSAGKMGQGQAREESGLKETKPRIQSAPLSLIHPQLKVGTANQRHPFSPERFFSAQFNKRKQEHQNGTRNGKVV